MVLLQKIALTLIIILFILSILKDLTVGTITQPIRTEEASIETQTTVTEKRIEKIHPMETPRYQVVSHTTQPGDTVLSIIESLNRDRNALQVSQVILDFEKLNPNVDPHQIQPDTAYLFPVYK